MNHRPFDIFADSEPFGKRKRDASADEDDTLSERDPESSINNDESDGGYVHIDDVNGTKKQVEVAEDETTEPPPVIVKKRSGKVRLRVQ